MIAKSGDDIAPFLLAVQVHTPAHSQIGSTLSYLSAVEVPPGSLVRVPMGRREILGVVWDSPGPSAASTLASDKLRPVSAVLSGLPPLNAAWRRLVDFAARYYQRAPGEVALAALPPQLRDLDDTQLARRLQRKPRAEPAPAPASPAPVPSPEQQAALAALRDHRGTALLFGTTGSGKTEVYLQRVQELLDANPEGQAIVMVPEINLTPQLHQRFVARFAPQFGALAVVTLHSGMTHPQRLAAWLAAHAGQARVVLGTRMAVFASVPRLGLIVVDEEHDPSYKQQEGARYSARDLAVYRGHLENVPVLLGSATPSLESWHLSRPASEEGRYLRLPMLQPHRRGASCRACGAST
jgi:primosomal protein N' (replication factor Y)